MNLQFIFEKVLTRLKNPAFWTGIISLILLIFTTAGIEISTMNTWGELYKAVFSTINNPCALLCIIGAIVGVSLNPATKGFKDNLNGK